MIYKLDLTKELSEEGSEHPKGIKRTEFKLINPVVKEIDYSEHKDSIYLSPIESLAEVYCLDPNDLEESHKEAIEFLAEDKINKIKYDENNDLAEDF